MGRVVTPAAVESFGSEEAPIDAILVFSDSSNWYLDLQLMYDLILSGTPLQNLSFHYRKILPEA